MADPVERLTDPALREELIKIRARFGSTVRSTELQSTVRGFQSQRGIYRPSGSEYALWVRQTLGGPYADQTPEFHPDGSWTYRYAPEARAGVPAAELPSNVGLLNCMRNRVPVGVFRQVRGSSGRAEYEVLGLAQVVAFEDTHFVLRGEPIDWTHETLPEEVVPSFRPFEIESPNLAPSFRTLRDRRFGEVLRRVYHDRCSLCKVGYRMRGAPLGLEAAHIIPVESRGNLADVRNGLLLCRNHHLLFDRHGWAIDEDLRVTVTDDPEFRASARENHLLSWEGQRLPNLPNRSEDHPAVEALQWRLAEFERYWA